MSAVVIVDAQGHIWANHKPTNPKIADLEVGTLRVRSLTRLDAPREGDDPT